MQFSQEQSKISNFVLSQKVFAQHHDCLLYPANLQAWKTLPAGDQSYSLVLEDGFSRGVRGHELVTPELTVPNSNTELSYGDVVVVNIQGKGRRGVVLEHRQKLDQVIVKLEGTGELLARRVKELRLVADALRPYQMKGARTYFPWQDISEVLRCHGQQGTMDGRPIREQSDVRQAAMALTALSLSPVAPDMGKEKEGSTENRRFVFPPKEDDTSPLPRNVETKPRSFSLDSVPSLCRNRRRPAFHHQYSVPLTSSQGPSSPISYSGPVSPKSFDEGFASSDSSESSETPPYKRKKSQDEKKRKIFQCMWRGCNSVLASLPGIINHVRTSHLGPQSGEKYQDGEEEFYFNDVDIDLDSDLESASLGTFPSTDSLSVHSSDNDSNKPRHIATLSSSDDVCDGEIASQVKEKEKDTQQRELVSLTDKVKPTLAASPEKMSSSDKLRKVQNGRVKLNASRGRPGKNKRRSNSIGEDIRLNKVALNESVKKCRKMYGMESKHLWCTQCKWKKACVRFR